MAAETHSFTNLDAIIDQVHQLFDQWEAQAAFIPPLDLETLQQLRLAIHEWMANLVQHADFGDRPPDISIHVWPDGDHLRCHIDDNATTFQLADELKRREAALVNPFPERGMGLLMLQACTQGLVYQNLSSDRNRLAFRVSTGQDPWLNIPF